jgi:hypothetical protein
MTEFSKYFMQGLKSTLRLKNKTNLSYKGPWVSVLPNTVIDTFFVGDFMAAEYTIVIDAGNIDKEIIKCLVIAGPDQANLTVFGRTSLSQDIVELSASVNTSNFSLIANPINPIDIKLSFSANYYYTINELTRT